MYDISHPDQSPLTKSPGQKPPGTKFFYQGGFGSGGLMSVSRVAERRSGPLGLREDDESTLVKKIRLPKLAKVHLHQLLIMNK